MKMRNSVLSLFLLILSSANCKIKNSLCHCSELTPPRDLLFIASHLLRIFLFSGLRSFLRTIFLTKKNFSKLLPKICNGLLSPLLRYRIICFSGWCRINVCVQVSVWVCVCVCMCVYKCICLFVQRSQKWKLAEISSLCTATTIALKC